MIGPIEYQLQAAIDESELRNISVDVHVPNFDDALEALHEIYDGEIDSVKTTDGNGRPCLDVWGWTDDTPENGQDWRLYLYLAE